MVKVNDYISYDPEIHFHTKASERYISVQMKYKTGGVFDGWIPIEYRRTGLNLQTEDEIKQYLIKIYDFLNPNLYKEWLEDQKEFWDSKPNAGVTKDVFDKICSGEWICIGCKINNGNWARRFQDLKEYGYTFATKTPVNCPICKKKTTYVMCIHLPRYNDIDGNGYETWSNQMRKRILNLLGNYDAYEGKVSQNLLPDHKFSEIRWDDKTKGSNPESMSDDEIKAKFQLVSNQRNQQKREVCRRCFQTGERPSMFGIEFFYKGTNKWNKDIPQKGKEAEKGCEGCPWYDMEKWRKELMKALDDLKKRYGD